MSTVRNKVGELKKSRATTAVKTRDTSDIVTLVDKAAGGSFEAFGELYGIYLDRIYRYALYQVKDRMTAEDITEEVFVKAWKAIKSCKGKGNTFSAWIYRIAHNHIVNTFRDKQKCVSIDMENFVELNTPELTVETSVDQQELMNVVSELPPNQRQVVILKFIEGMDNREIGQIMRKSEGAVRVLQMRALNSLREKLGGGRYGNG